MSGTWASVRLAPGWSPWLIPRGLPGSSCSGCWYPVISPIKPMPHDTPLAVRAGWVTHDTFLPHSPRRIRLVISRRPLSSVSFPPSFWVYDLSLYHFCFLLPFFSVSRFITFFFLLLLHLHLSLLLQAFKIAIQSLYDFKEIYICRARADRKNKHLLKRHD